MRVFDWGCCWIASTAPSALADLELMAMAADAVGITAIARPRSNASADIQAVMDRGVKGVQIPHIITRADAERAVAAVQVRARGQPRPSPAGTRPDPLGDGCKDDRTL